MFKAKKNVLPVQPITAGLLLLSNKDVDSIRQYVMTKEEVATFLRVEPSTVYELTWKRSRHPLPFRRVENICASVGPKSNVGGMKQPKSFGGPTRTRTWNQQIMSLLL